MIRVGFIGTGGIAQRHIQSLNILKRTTYVAFSDLEISKAKAAAQANGGSAYSDYREMLANEELDAVFICTPPFVRDEPIAAAASRGLAIFCEKPPAFDAQSGQVALDAIRRAGVISNVGFMYRWLKIVDKASELMAGRKLGAIRSAFINGPAVHMKLPGWFFLKERSGGPLMDQAIHVLDLHRYFGGEVKAVHTFGNNRIQPKRKDFTIEEACTVNLQFESGLIGVHMHTWACDVGLGQVELISDLSRITLDLFENRLFGKIDGVDISFSPRDDCYLTEVDRFLTAVERKDPRLLRSPYDDGLNTCAVAWAGLTSIDSGKVEPPRRFSGEQNGPEAKGA